MKIITENKTNKRVDLKVKMNLIKMKLINNINVKLYNIVTQYCTRNVQYFLL